MAFAKAPWETHPQLPLAFNYSSSFRWHQDSNPFTFTELGGLGSKFIVITLDAAHAGRYAVWKAMEDLAKNREQAQWRLERIKAGHPTEMHQWRRSIDVGGPETAPQAPSSSTDFPNPPRYHPSPCYRA